MAIKLTKVGRAFERVAAEKEELRTKLATRDAALRQALAALEEIHKGCCLTAQDSRSRDDDRYCIGAVMTKSEAAIAAIREVIG